MVNCKCRLYFSVSKAFMSSTQTPFQIKQVNTRLQLRQQIISQPNEMHLLLFCQLARSFNVSVATAI